MLSALEEGKSILSRSLGQTQGSSDFLTPPDQPQFYLLSGSQGLYDVCGVPSEVDSGKVPLWAPSVSRQDPGEGWTRAAWVLLESILHIQLHLWSIGQGHWEWLWEFSWRLPPLWANSHHFSRTGLQPGLLSVQLLSACWYSCWL